MTGIFFRTDRDGKWQPIELEHLTPEERRTVMRYRDAEFLHSCIDALAAQVVDSERLLNKTVHALFNPVLPVDVAPQVPPPGPSEPVPPETH